MKAGIPIAAVALALAAGCQPPPANVPVPPNPSPTPNSMYPADVPKPLPPQQSEEMPPAAYDDPPLVDQRLPEEAWFVNAYNHVGRPRIAVFVNRTLNGELVPPAPIAVSSVDTYQRSTGAVNVTHDQGSAYNNYWNTTGQYDYSHFRSTGPAEYHETTTTYLQPGQYDEADLQALDYTEMESLLTDWLQCNGQVTLVSPDFIRSQLSPQQVADLQAGKPSGLNDLGRITGADVLIQFQAHPTRRDGQLVILLIGEAVNVRGGESIAHASVEMPTPIDRYKLNNFTRFLARKVIHGMVQTWESAPPPANAGPANSGPGATPQQGNPTTPNPVPPAPGNPPSPLPTPAPVTPPTSQPSTVPPR